MKKKMMKIFAIIITLCVLFGAIPMSASADCTDGHNWSEPVWTWNLNMMPYTVRAEFTCADCGETSKKVTLNVTETVTKQAIYFEEGEVTYSANVTGPDGKTYTGTKTEIISAPLSITHDWGTSDYYINGGGALLENFTVSEIMKGYQNAGLEPYLYFYRDRDSKEIDVILEGDGKLCPLEIKKTATPDKRLTRVFNVINKSPLQLGTGAVLCMADKFSAFDSSNLIIPIWMI